MLYGMQHNKHHHRPCETPPDFLVNSTPLFAAISQQNDSLKTKSLKGRRFKVTGPADVLAYVQCTLGFAPSNSLVVIAFAGNHMSTVVRCDLPETLQHMLRSDTPESVTFMDFGITEDQELDFIKSGRDIGDLLVREPSTTSCLLVYLADDVTVSNQHALAVMGAANAVFAAQFGLQGVPVQEAWLIHHDMLWHLRCAETTECMVQGERVGDPQATEIFKILDPKGAVAGQTHTEPRRLHFPPPSPRASRKDDDTSGLLEHRPQVVLKRLSLWDTQLQNGPTMLHTDEVAELLAALEHPPVRDAILATACFDLTTALRGMVTLEKFPAQFAAVADVTSNLLDGIAVKDCLKGQSERIPNWSRIAELERLCHQLLPLSDLSSGGIVAGLLVWIEWVRGRGSIALEFLRQARKRFPADQFLILLQGYVRECSVADWAIRTESAWNPQHAA